ncbi:chaplin family protein [Streptomyces sp. NPDC023838]|uniref:chaplin family protein n=1 Tax=Streptomyces sp. NPDC023838 TaxID=3154325 RepID=UPI0033F86052
MGTTSLPFSFPVRHPLPSASGKRNTGATARGIARAGVLQPRRRRLRRGIRLPLPRVLSGNLIQVVVSIPINICGNRIG